MRLYADELPDGLLRERRLPGRKHERGVRQQRRHLRRVPDRDRMSERVLCLHADELSERMLREQHVSTRNGERRLWHRRRHVHQLSRWPGVRPRPDVRVHTRELPRWLLPRRRLPGRDHHPGVRHGRRDLHPVCRGPGMPGWLLRLHDPELCRMLPEQRVRAGHHRRRLRHGWGCVRHLSSGHRVQLERAVRMHPDQLSHRMLSKRHLPTR